MRFKLNFLVGVFLALAGMGVCAEGGASSSEGWYREIRDLYYNLPVRVSYRPESAELSARVWDYLESIDDVFNDYKAGSEISVINRADDTNEVTLSPMLAEAFRKARQAWVLSEGVFDVTCAPLRNLWKQAEEQDVVPTDVEIDAVWKQCGLNWVEQNDRQLMRRRDDLQFDFGGIIKGIIADHVVNMLKESGAQSALVQIGGETVAFGFSPKNRPYRIAVQHPELFDGAWCVIQDPGTGLSASTSGSYENSIQIKGEEFYHIMDMRTGRPAKTDVVSVSIAFPETGRNWLADTLSTTGVLLGPKKTFEIVQSLGGEAMFLIRENGEIKEMASSGWETFQ